MTQWTTRERMLRMLAHQEADRPPILDAPWGSTLQRWHREGLPEGVDWLDYFGLDHFSYIGADNSPRYPHTTLEETDEYVLVKDKWGTTRRSWKKHGGVPEFLSFTIQDADSWAKAKARMTPDRDRVDWKYLQREYPRWRQRGDWVVAGFWFGFDVTHSWAVGTERVLQAMIDEPEWLIDIFNHYLDVDIALFEMVLDAGYQLDAIHWPDDMGYKGTQFFSLGMYREMLRPVHQRAIDWAHARGIKVELHSCGNILPFIPDLVEMGVDILNPLEVKAGMDPLQLKAQYGKQLTFHGGINAALFWDMDKLFAHMRQVVPGMRKDGGYVFSSDHSIPDSVSLEQFRQFVTLAKELATY